MKNPTGIALSWTELDSNKREETERIKMHRVEQYQKLAHARMFPRLRVVVDLSFTSQQTLRECNSLLKQLSCAYGYIRSCSLSSLLSLEVTSYHGGIVTLCHKHGVASWPILKHSIPLNEVYQPEDVIYLSPDAPYEIDQLDNTKIYVIGGIVDRTVRKNETMHYASRIQYQTARLPVRKYMPEARTHILNVNSVIMALNEVMNHRDWARAFQMLGSTMTLREIAISFYFHLAIAYFQIRNWISQYSTTIFARPVNEYHHKILIIGDDFASGIGDSFHLGNSGGLSTALHGFIQRSDKIRHKWEVINAGIPLSKTDDWQAGAKYFDRIFRTGSARDAEIVVVIAGSIEARHHRGSKDGSNMMSNLIQLCDALRRKEKRVFLATLALSPQNDHIQQGINEQIKAYCARSYKHANPLVLGPRLDLPVFQRRQNQSFDEFRFNAHGFHVLAQKFSEELIPAMTAVEWITWKEHLERGRC
ncbi:unnamed protein product [Albugo candida]|uniref:tRNA (guanine(9)-N(1))-methyltransferase n=1 Tax=Albugo candida TaxID=65357 RepID=A0A024FXX2_9STRA|nr:unnamed protein product [Albugo candida]|eukprot:CCI39356.1 unnamed protein product [Albugo candida]